MGEEIRYSHFKRADFNSFEKRLDDETRLLLDMFKEDRFSSRDPVAGYELEAWLIDRQQLPRPDNEVLLRYADNELLSPELARFNFELNVEPEVLEGGVLGHFRDSLNALWQKCGEQAALFGNDILGIGILPTLTDAELNLDNISLLDRYRALNEQVLRLRRGEPIQLNIVGNEHLQSDHMDVMLEAASTSLQIHIQVPQALSVEYFNASVLLSAATVGVATNSPFLFGKQLWEETRIPVFEQSVPTGGFGEAAHGPVQRVGFGMDYVRDSLAECFTENMEHYPVLLPFLYDSEPDEFRHLRLHNGTIWRWNRPLIGFDDDATPHLRIEHRVCAAGPSIEDNIANIAFYYGLAHYYATIAEPADEMLEFSKARDNFYAAARLGLQAHVDWADGERCTLQCLILDRLLVECETGLHRLGIYQEDIDHYLSIIDRRVSSGQTGSAWQREFATRNNNDMRLLTRVYLEHQRSGDPVHEWEL